MILGSQIDNWQPHIFVNEVLLELEFPVTWMSGAESPKYWIGSVFI